MLGLWDSWDDDAFVRDKESGLFFHPDKLHALNHKGENYSVRGPLNVPRTPQGRPVIVQAGGSEDMIKVAAEFAEVIFCAPLTLEAAQKFYADLKARVAAHGRAPDQVKIMPGLSAIIGRTEAEAQEQYEYLQSLIHPVVAREILSLVLGSVDLSAYPLDGPFPENLPLSNASQSTFQYVIEMARNEKLTMRQVAMRVAGARGKSVVRGLARAGRRSHGAVVQGGRLRRLQPDAAVPAGRARRFRRAGAAGAAAARPVPHRIRGPHVARASRPRAPGQPLREGGGGRVRSATAGGMTHGLRVVMAGPSPRRA